jgi:excisionase family DNA binding protein
MGIAGKEVSSRGGTPSLVNIDAVADRLGITVRHVRRLVAERRIPYVKVGHLVRFDPAEISAWIDAARRPLLPDHVGLERIQCRPGGQEISEAGVRRRR